MRDVFMLGFVLALALVFMVWLTVSEIRNAKSNPFWVAFNGAVITISVGATIAIVALIPNK